MRRGGRAGVSERPKLWFTPELRARRSTKPSVATDCPYKSQIPGGGLAVDALDGGAACCEFVFEPLEAAVEMIDAVDGRLAFGRKCGDNERDRGAQVGGHHRRAFERAHAFDGRTFAVELD